MKKDRILGLGVVVFALWAGVLADASALTLGRARGAAVLGQPFEVSIPLQYGADDDIAPNCFNAVVYYGDSMQGGGRVSLNVESGKQANNATIRISSSSSVNEPMVLVELTSRCGANSVRRFTFLSDIAAETLGTVEPAAVVAAQAPASAVAVPVAAAPANVAAGSSAVAGSAPRTKNVKQSGTGQQKPRLKLSVSESAVGKQGSKPAAPNQAQLVDELQARIDELTQKQAASDADKARVKALEAELQALQASTARNQQTVQQLTAAVAKAEEDQSSSTLVYLLFAALLASVAALAYVVLQRRNGTAMRPWWSGAGADTARNPVPAAPVVAKVAPGATKQPPVATVAAPKPQPAPVKTAAPNQAVDVDIDIDGVVPEMAAGPAAPANVTESAPTRGDRRDFMHSGSATMRAINTREMLDVRQQAEFFMALGQHDEAIKVLESNIIGSPDSNPLIYLDLLHVLHTLSRRDAFERYRKEFNLIFTGQVPEYAQFLGQGVALEEYADICEQIAELWPSDDAMDYIEQCLVRTPEDEPDHGFDLEAFRDLLLLHGVLRRLGQTADSSMAPFSTSRSSATIPVPVAPELPPAVAATAGQSVDGISAPLPTVPDVALDVPSDGSASAIDLDLDVAAPASDNLIDFDISPYKGKPVIKDPKA